MDSLESNGKQKLKRDSHQIEDKWEIVIRDRFLRQFFTRDKTRDIIQYSETCFRDSDEDVVVKEAMHDKDKRAKHVPKALFRLKKIIIVW